MTHFFPTLPRSLVDLAAAYVASRGKSNFLSVSIAIRAIRAALPTCEATDSELADIIASAAIESGTPVAFDFDTKTQRSPIATVPSCSS